jgi:hypothetical protein
VKQKANTNPLSHRGILGNPLCQGTFLDWV